MPSFLGDNGRQPGFPKKPQLLVISFITNSAEAGRWQLRPLTQSTELLGGGFHAGPVPAARSAPSEQQGPK
jgi:hypothetical protein